MRRKIGNILFAIAMVVMVCCIFILFFGEDGVLRSKEESGAEQNPVIQGAESANAEEAETEKEAESEGQEQEADSESAGSREDPAADAQEKDAAAEGQDKPDSADGREESAETDGPDSDDAPEGREENKTSDPQSADGQAQAGSETDGASQQAEEDGQTAGEEKEASLVFTMGSDSDAERLVPQDVLDQVAAINQGESMAEVTGMEELENYYALTTMHIILAKDRETGEEATGSGTLSLYVPNLLKSLKDVSALFYDLEEQEWRLVAIDVVDAPNKRVSMTLNGPGMLTTIYRLE
ncbi:MAG: hypothetical protein HFI46_08455 [Lachnospiraceae bacterium]|nr:hypothetical protein [Lachnospiraceae bacterium]